MLFGVHVPYSMVHYPLYVLLKWRYYSHKCTALIKVIISVYTLCSFTFSTRLRSASCTLVSGTGLSEYPTGYITSPSLSCLSPRVLHTGRDERHIYVQQSLLHSRLALKKWGTLYTQEIDKQRTEYQYEPWFWIEMLDWYQIRFNIV